LKNVYVKSVVRFHHQWRLHTSFGGVSLKSDTVVHIEFTVVNLRQQCFVINIFLAVKIARNPKRFMIACKIELRQFLAHYEIIQMLLLWKFIAECQTVVEEPKHQSDIARGGRLM